MALGPGDRVVVDGEVTGADPVGEASYREQHALVVSEVRASHIAVVYATNDAEDPVKKLEEWVGSHRSIVAPSMGSTLRARASAGPTILIVGEPWAKKSGCFDQPKKSGSSKVARAWRVRAVRGDDADRALELAG